MTYPEPVCVTGRGNSRWEGPEARSSLLCENTRKLPSMADTSGWEGFVGPVRNLGFSTCNGKSLWGFNQA